MGDESQGTSGAVATVGTTGYCPYCGRPHSARAVFCGNCGRRIEEAAVAGTGAAPAEPPVVSPTAATPPEPAALRPAGFWVRLAAFCIDVAAITFAASFAGATAGDGVAVLVLYIGAPVYMIAWECSSYQATPGKLVLKLKVVDARGKRLGGGISVARTLASVLCYLSLGVGFAMLVFRKDRCALHDLVTGTRVVGRTHP